MTVSDPYRDALERLGEALGRGPDRDAWPVLAERAASFARLVASWNEKLDLTAARAPDAIAEILFADALVLARPGVVRPREAVVDVGSGAGGPALALAILREDLRVVLLEPKGKRVAFLRTAVGSLDLAARVKVVEGRVDPRRPAAPPGGPFDVACSRATFDPATWADAGLALAPSALVLLAGDDAPPSPGGARVEASIAYELPFHRAPRRIARLGRAA
jgi:16S rRNA (guanine527-N7)-methyltransferase